MKAGDHVLVTLAHRADGNVGGWEWRDFPATVIVVHRVTAIVERDGWERQEVVPLTRIKALRPASTR